MFSLFSWNLISKYKKEVVIIFGIIAIVGYITYLRHTINSLHDDYNALTESIKKERIASQINAKNQELKYRELETKYTIDMFKKKMDAQTQIRSKVIYIKNDDINHTLNMDGKCAEYMKGRYNEKNAINRLI